MRLVLFLLSAALLLGCLYIFSSQDSDIADSHLQPSSASHSAGTPKGQKELPVSAPERDPALADGSGAKVEPSEQGAGILDGNFEFSKPPSGPLSAEETKDWIESHRDEYFEGTRQSIVRRLAAYEQIKTTESPRQVALEAFSLMQASVSVILAMQGRETYSQGPLAMGEPAGGTHQFMINHWSYTVNFSEFPEYGELFHLRSQNFSDDQDPLPLPPALDQAVIRYAEDALLYFP